MGVNRQSFKGARHDGISSNCKSNIELIGVVDKTILDITIFATIILDDDLIDGRSIVDPSILSPPWILVSALPGIARPGARNLLKVLLVG
jgi:hypothetical protein